MACRVRERERKRGKVRKDEIEKGIGRRITRLAARNTSVVVIIRTLGMHIKEISRSALVICFHIVLFLLVFPLRDHMN